MTDEAPESATLGVIPAGFWRRVAAWVIDTIIVLVGTYLVGSFLWPDLVETTTHVSESDGARLEVVSYALSWLGSIVFGIALGVYTALQEAGRAQATIGKRMLGLRVTGLDGGRISLLTAILRCWPLWLPRPRQHGRRPQFHRGLRRHRRLHRGCLHPPQAGPARHVGALPGGAPAAACHITSARRALAPAGLLRHDRAPASGGVAGARGRRHGR